MRILIIEDDRDLCGLLETNLLREGFAVDMCHDGEEGLYWMRQSVHDLVLLDRMLPGMDGLCVLQEARKGKLGVPVLMMTALGSLPQVVEGLDSGADDYIVKPFAMQELLARIRAMSRRPAQMVARQEWKCGDLCLSQTDKQLFCGGQSCSLSRREGDLLELLMKNPDKTLTREVIFSYVWGLEAPVEEGNLDNYIHFVRDRLKEVKSKAVIRTVRGVGYRLETGHV